MSGNIPTVAPATPTNKSGNIGGQPVQIIDITSDHKFKLDEEALKRILYHPKAKNRKVFTIHSIDDLLFLFFCCFQRFALFQSLGLLEKENHFY